MLPFIEGDKSSSAQVDVLKLLSQQDNDYLTCLHLCCLQSVSDGCLEKSELLLRLGVDVNCQSGDISSQTPLHLAISKV